MKRREFLKYALAAGAAAPFFGNVWQAVAQGEKQKSVAEKPASGPWGAVCLFSKPIDACTSEELVEIPARAGYNGIDLTFRKRGHIEPAAGSAALAAFVRIAEKAGLAVPMAATDIVSADDPQTEMIVKAMADNGIKNYRFGIFNYDKKRSIPENLDFFREQIEKLSELNERFGIRGELQNHAGAHFGSAVWDGYIVFKGIDNRYAGIQYDIRHAMAEGMQSWDPSLRAICDRIGTICIKDFIWNKRPDGSFVPLTVPLGEGIVDFGRYFRVLDEFGIRCPISVHVEYPMLTAEEEKLTRKRQIDRNVAVLARDLEVLKKYIKSICNS